MTEQWECEDCTPSGACDDCSTRYWLAYDRERERDASPWRGLPRVEVLGQGFPAVRTPHGEWTDV